METSFRELHHGDRPLVLPNAWDIGSALAFVDAGFPAVATTSAGINFSAGHADGTQASREANLALARALTRLPVLVSMDIEDAYSEDPSQAAEYVARLAELGVAGINIEDSFAEQLVAPERQAAKIAAIKARCPEIFINARVDTFWFGIDATVAATAQRAAAYVEAGADGVFVPGASRPEDLRELASEIAAPLNVLALPNLTVAELGELGVRRVSTGSLPYRAAIHASTLSATALRDGGALPPAPTYHELQRRAVEYARKSNS